jgi:hypothetical protein
MYIRRLLNLMQAPMSTPQAPQSHLVSHVFNFLCNFLTTWHNKHGTRTDIFQFKDRTDSHKNNVLK